MTQAAVKSEQAGAESVASDSPLSPYAMTILGLCVLIGMVEGYDAQAMAFAAPLVAENWGLSSGTLGLLLATSIVGMVTGNFLLSPLGDRWGRRPSVIAALLLVGPATAAGALAPDATWLFVTRFLAGLGLGLAFPNVIALAMEIMPARWRTLAVVLVSCGYPFGGALGGITAAKLISSYGYAAIFLLGGGATIFVTLLCAAFLPESPSFLARQKTSSEKLTRLLKRLGNPALVNSGPATDTAAGRPKSTVAALFESHRRFATIMLWVINFANMSLVYYFVTWLPTILVRSGTSAEFAAGSLSLLSGTGMLGGLALAFLLPRLGAIRTLGGAYFIGIISAAILATFTTYDRDFLIVLAIAGAAIVGSQFCLAAVVNQFYPSGIRATASGYATGIGRLGAVGAPLAGAAVMGYYGTSNVAFGVAVIPAMIALVGVIMLGARNFGADQIRSVSQ